MATVNKGIPSQEDKSINAELQKQLADMKEDISGLKTPDKPKGFRGRDILHSNESGLPMNDSQLQAKMRDDHHIDKQQLDEGFKSLQKRVGELESTQPDVRKMDTWDVPITLLPSSATLADVVKKVNLLIQRDKRENRIKL